MATPINPWIVLEQSEESLQTLFALGMLENGINPIVVLQAIVNTLNARDPVLAAAIAELEALEVMLLSPRINIDLINHHLMIVTDVKEKERLLKLQVLLATNETLPQVQAQLLKLRLLLK